MLSPGNLSHALVRFWYAAISDNAPHFIPTSYLVFLLFKLIRYLRARRSEKMGAKENILGAVCAICGGNPCLARNLASYEFSSPLRGIYSASYNTTPTKGGAEPISDEN